MLDGLLDSRIALSTHLNRTSLKICEHLYRFVADSLFTFRALKNVRYKNATKVLPTNLLDCSVQKCTLQSSYDVTHWVADVFFGFELESGTSF